MPTKNEQLVSDTKAVFNNHEAYVYVTYTVNIVNIQYKSVVKVTLLQVFPLTRLRFVPILMQTAMQLPMIKMRMIHIVRHKNA